MTTPEPIATIVVPAHDEEARLPVCLEALVGDADGPLVDVIVAANGCSDATVAVASQFPVHVLDIAAPGKAAAINAAEGVVRGYPRVYLDADVVLSASSVVALARELSGSRPLLAVPTRVLDLTGASPAVRAYHRCANLLRDIRQDQLGCGVYAVNRPARARWDVLPDGIADDAYVHSRFSTDERLTVADAVSVVRPPLTIASLLAVRVRIYAGNLSQVQQHGRLIRRSRSWAPLWRDPAALAGAPIYVAVTAVAKVLARRRVRSQDVRWSRDTSARSA